MRPKFDEKDEAIRARRLEEWNQKIGPRVGDFVFFPGEENPRRFTYNWGEDIQTTFNRESGSFYFGNGYMSFSGSLDSPIPLDKLEDMNQTQEGRCWFFHHNWAAAYNSVETTVPCRVYRYNP